MATVNITITPVNDAPVVGDLAATTVEDTVATLDLLAGVVDVDSSTLTAGRGRPGSAGWAEHSSMNPKFNA